METDLTIYICGRRTGMPNEGIDAIQGAAHALRKKGLNVVSPVEVNINFLAATYSQKSQSQLKPTFPGLRADIFALLSTCNAIALMPGWEHAIGCRLEVAIGISFGYVFVDWESGNVIPRPRHVFIDTGYLDAPVAPYDFLDNPSRIG